MSKRIRRSLDSRDQGFGMIELLVVIIIIGVLAAIAIPIFLNQKKKAVNASIKSDLKSATTAARVVVDGNPTSSSNLFTSAAMTAGGFKVSPGNYIAIAGTPVAGWCIRGYNTASNANTVTNAYWWDSLKGGLQTRGAQPTTGACAAATATAAGWNIL